MKPTVYNVTAFMDGDDPVRINTKDDSWPFQIQFGENGGCIDVYLDAAAAVRLRDALTEALADPITVIPVGASRR